MSITVPAPIAVQPSGKFDGDDGRWSTFSVRLGNPAVDVNLLPSTLIPETWAVEPIGCSANGPSNCTALRYAYFNTNYTSTTWMDQGTWSLAEEGNLGIDQNSIGGAYGYDTLGITAQGEQPVVLDHQIIAGIATTEFYLGMLGLAPRVSNFNGLNQQQSSFLTSLRDQKHIPSLSYGYTAGAFYRQKTLASLTLGGYDASRLIPNDVMFPVGPVDTRDLVVGIQSIVYSSAAVSSQSLLNTGIWTLIDSTTPNIWLPQDACDAFAAAFGLEFQPTKLMYTINSTMHDRNLKTNASVAFQLGASLSGGTTVAITLPYASFDLSFTDPSAPISSSVNYFPLRQAANDRQYTLGRTFLQEAFLTVDYERGNFSVSQCDVSNQPSQIVAIASTRSPASSSAPAVPSSTIVTAAPNPAAASSSSSSFSTGAIAGIAIGIVALAALATAAFIFLFCLPRRRRRRAEQAAMQAALNTPLPPELHYETKNHAHSFSNTPTMTEYFPPIGHHPHKPVPHVADNELLSPASHTYGADQGATHNIPVELAVTDTPGAELPSPHADARSLGASALNTPPAVSSVGDGEPPWGAAGTNLEPASPLSLTSAPSPLGPLPPLRNRPSLDQRMSGSTVLTDAPLAFPFPSPERESPLSPVPGVSTNASARVSASASAFQSPQVGYAAFYEDAPTPSVRDSGSRQGATSPEVGEETTLMKDGGKW